jgi:hypothetical protein
LTSLASGWYTIVIQEKEKEKTAQFLISR